MDNKIKKEIVPGSIVRTLLGIIKPSCSNIFLSNSPKCQVVITNINTDAFNYDDYEPEPLTQDWFEKVFDLSPAINSVTGTRYESRYIINENIYIHLSPFTKTNVIYFGNLGNGDKICEVPFVHQFQNIYRMITGKEVPLKKAEAPKMTVFNTMMTDFSPIKKVTIGSLEDLISKANDVNEIKLNDLKNKTQKEYDDLSYQIAIAQEEIIRLNSRLESITKSADLVGIDTTRIFQKKI